VDILLADIIAPELVRSFLAEQTIIAPAADQQIVTVGAGEVIVAFAAVVLGGPIETALLNRVVAAAAIDDGLGGGRRAKSERVAAGVDVDGGGGRAEGRAELDGVGALGAA